MLHVVVAAKDQPKEFASRFESDLSRGIVVLRSDCPMKHGGFAEAHYELDSAEAKRIAVGFANSLGMGDARVNGMTTAIYPVTAAGVPLEYVRGDDGQPLPLTHPKMKVDHYRVEVPVTRRLI
jgi:hypothetical protein